MNKLSFIGGSVKKAYVIIGKKSICGKDRNIYKKNNAKTSSKVYIKNKGKENKIKKFEKAMIAAGKWKATKKTASKKLPKPCKADQHRNPATGRCVKNKAVKSPKKRGRPRKKST